MAWTVSPERQNNMFAQILATSLSFRPRPNSPGRRRRENYVTEPIRQTREMGQTGRRSERAHSPLDLPFLAFFTVYARGGAAAAASAASEDRNRKESGERNKLSRSIDCSVLFRPFALSLLHSLVARVEGLFRAKVTNFH